MRRLAWFVLASAIVVSFQNCSQQGFDAALTGDLSSISGVGTDAEIDTGTGGASSVKEVGSLKAADVRFVESSEVALASDLTKIVDLSSASTVRGVSYARVRFIVDRLTGKLNLIDYNNNLVKSYCLKSEQKQGLDAILDGAKLCQTEVDDSAICTQVLTPAHTFIHPMSGTQVVRLGEASNGCGEGKIELCGVLASQFQTFWADLKAQKDQLACN